MTTTTGQSLAAWGIGAVMGLALGVVVTWVLTTSTNSEGEGDGDAILANPIDSFAIGGDLAHPIVPGQSAPVDLALSNPHEFPMIVSNLRVAVVAVEAPHANTAYPCSLEDFTVTQPPAGLEITVGPGDDSTLGTLGVPASHWPTVGMRDAPTNQDGCKSAELTLAYSASGRQDR